MSKRQRVTGGELWIGLAEVEQFQPGGPLGNAIGAFTNAIGVAVSRANFRQQVKEALAELDLRLKRLENAETLKARTARCSIHPELEQVAREVSNSRNVGFGTFHSYDAK